MLRISTLSSAENRALEEFKERVLRALSGRIELIQLFGSKARGDYKDGSDLDVLVVLREAEDADDDVVSDLAFDVLLEHAVFISPLVLSEKKYKDLTRYPFSIVHDIEKDGVVLWPSN
ncbi:MAG: nucleotidyltransferase domain-containing protein [Anaerolineae bacterium]